MHEITNLKCEVCGKPRQGNNYHGLVVCKHNGDVMNKRKEFEEKFVNSNDVRNQYAVINGTTAELWQWIEQQLNEYQKFFVGQNIVFTFPREEALKNIPDENLTSEGKVIKVWLKLGTPMYVVRLDKSVLSEKQWNTDGRYILKTE